MGSAALSANRLRGMHEVMAGHVESGRMPGLVTLVSRGGELYVDAIGRQAIGFARAAEGVPGLLDVCVPGDRRLNPNSP